jgi:hypothetical protein
MLSISVILSSLASLAVVVAFYFGNGLDFLPKQAHQPNVIAHDAVAGSEVTIDPIPFSTRAYWMRRANSVLAELLSPCPFAAFGTVVVNHTDTDGLGELVCIGLNAMWEYGNPTLHGIATGALSDKADMDN